MRFLIDTNSKRITGIVIAFLMVAIMLGASYVGATPNNAPPGKQRDLSLLKPLTPSLNKGPVSLPHKSGVVESPPPGTPPANNVPQPSAGSTEESVAGSTEELSPGTASVNHLASVVAGTSPQNEPTVSVSPVSGAPINGEKLVAGANDYRSGDAQCGVYTTTNGGTSWTDRGVLPGPFTSATGLTLPVQGDPVVKHARNGNVFYACLPFDRNFGGNSGSIYVSKSKNNGASFGAPVPVRKGSLSEFNDKPWEAVDTFTDSPFRDNVYVCWTQFTSTATIQFSRSTDYGGTFSPQMTLSSSPSNQGCTVDVGPDGAVYVAWEDFNTIPHSLDVRKSTDGGATFSAPVLVNTIIDIPSPLPNNGFRTNSFPDIATARTPYNGDVHIVWADYRFFATTGADILIANSNDGGATWTTDIVNSADTTDTDQFFPTVDVSYSNGGTLTGTMANGIIHVYYYTKQFDSMNKLVDVEEAHCHSNALTCPSGYTLTRVTPASENFNNCQFGSPTSFVGDYIDNSIGRANHGVWTDCRNVATTGQDIFEASVSPP